MNVSIDTVYGDTVAIHSREVTDTASGRRIIPIATATTIGKYVGSIASSQN
ncbi:MULTISPECIES: hypothetical protein [Halorussus]|uniref:hypothetical protein n=1 Tax=Halorussus TaxID=1070314 RepID=UPI0013B3763B|nr:MULTISPECIES: hypothetical protein [Halorussus]NHN59382.1 hypothetical protein [Halorussus sp. JP-T4]